MRAIIILKSLSAASTMFGLLGTMQEFPLDILASIFGLSIALSWLAKSENTKGSEKVNFNVPINELRKGITIKEA
jgi:hypothetical protein